MCARARASLSRREEAYYRRETIRNLSRRGLRLFRASGAAAGARGERARGKIYMWGRGKENTGHHVCEMRPVSARPAVNSPVNAA